MVNRRYIYIYMLMRVLCTHICQKRLFSTQDQLRKNVVEERMEFQVILSAPKGFI